MAQLEPHNQDINRPGAALVYIAAEKREGVWQPAKYLTEHTVSFPFLLDEDRSITKAYGLYHAIGHDAFRIGHPATVVIDHRGMVRYLYRGDNQMDRAPVEEVLNSIRTL